MKKIHFKKAKLSAVSIIVLTFTTVISFLLLFTNAWIISLAGLIPLVLILGVQEGVDIDLEKRMYRSYLSILGISPAKWKPVPDGTKVGIRILKLTANRTIAGVPMGSQSSIQTMELFLYTPQPARIVLRASNNFSSLHKDAEYLYQCLGCEIVVDKRL